MHLYIYLNYQKTISHYLYSILSVKHEAVITVCFNNKSEKMFKLKFFKYKAQNNTFRFILFNYRVTR